MGSKPDNNSRLDAEVFVPLKYWSNFLGSPNLPLMNSKIELYLIWLRNCIISEISRTSGVSSNPDVDPPIPVEAATLTTRAIFQINNAKLYSSSLFYL